jgi:uncharacterized protein YjbJ (UPF0337 family)
MSHEIQHGRWLQVRGRVKRTWAKLVGDEELAANGNADVVAGALEESLGVAKKEAIRKVSRGVDQLAAVAKRAVKTLER